MPLAPRRPRGPALPGALGSPCGPENSYISLGNCHHPVTIEQSNCNIDIACFFATTYTTHQPKAYIVLHIHTYVRLHIKT